MDALKQVLDSFNISADLRWTWGEGGTERTLEKSWTDIVHSHEVWMDGRERELEGIGRKISIQPLKGHVDGKISDGRVEINSMLCVLSKTLS